MASKEGLGLGEGASRPFLPPLEKLRMASRKRLRLGERPEAEGPSGRCFFYGVAERWPGPLGWAAWRGAPACVALRCRPASTRSTGLGGAAWRPCVCCAEVPFSHDPAHWTGWRDAAPAFAAARCRSALTRPAGLGGAAVFFFPLCAPVGIVWLAA